jgi:hypothetical protein
MALATSQPSIMGSPAPYGTPDNLIVPKFSGEIALWGYLEQPYLRSRLSADRHR